MRNRQIKRQGTRQGKRQRMEILIAAKALLGKRVSRKEAEELFAHQEVKS